MAARLWQGRQLGHFIFLIINSIYVLFLKDKKIGAVNIILSSYQGGQLISSAKKLVSIHDRGFSTG